MERRTKKNGNAEQKKQEKVKHMNWTSFYSIFLIIFWTLTLIFVPFGYFAGFSAVICALLMIYYKEE